MKTLYPRVLAVAVGLLFPVFCPALTTVVVEIPSLDLISDSDPNPSSVNVLGQSVPQGSPVTLTICYDETVENTWSQPPPGASPIGRFGNAVVSAELLIGAGSAVTLPLGTNGISVGSSLTYGDSISFSLNDYAAGIFFDLTLGNPIGGSISNVSSLSPLPSGDLGTSIYFELLEGIEQLPGEFDMIQGVVYRDLPASVRFVEGHIDPLTGSTSGSSGSGSGSASSGGSGLGSGSGGGDGSNGVTGTTNPGNSSGSAAGQWYLALEPTAAEWQGLPFPAKMASSLNMGIVSLGSNWYWGTVGEYYYFQEPYIWNDTLGIWFYTTTDASGSYFYNFQSMNWDWRSRDGGQSMLGL